MSFERGGVWVNPLAVTHGISDVNLVEWATLFLASKEHLHHQIYTVVPSENYAQHGKTQLCLLNALKDDCNKLYSDGIEACCPNTETKKNIVSGILSHMTSSR